jgi:hypothetical protein
VGKRAKIRERRETVTKGAAPEVQSSAGPQVEAPVAAEPAPKRRLSRRRPKAD